MPIDISLRSPATRIVGRSASRLRGVILLAAAFAVGASCTRRTERQPPGESAGDASIQPQAARPATPAPQPAGRPVVALVSWGGDRSPADEVGAGTLSRGATAIDHLRADLPPGGVVVLDAGDLAAPSVAARGTRGRGATTPQRTMLDVLVRMGAGAILPGEADLDRALPRLRTDAHAAKAPMIAANLVDAAGRRVFEPHQMLDAGGIRVGVLGVMAPANPRLPPRFRVSDPIEAARSAASELRAAGAQLLVALVHGPDDQLARTVAAQVPGLVAVFHGHAGSQSRELIGDVWLVGRGDGEPRLDVITFEAKPGDAPDGGTGTPLSPGHARSVPVEPTLAEQLGVKLLMTLAQGEPVDLRRPDPPPENWTYGSSGACALCHVEETEQWKKTPHAEALETLEVDKRASDPRCLACHMTAFLLPGGTHYLKTAIKYFGAVGCESCHGPSVAHLRAPKKHTGTSRKVAAVVCLSCHTPDQIGEPFDYERLLPKVLGPGHGR